MAERLLELSTLIERPFITIDGTDYEFRAAQDLGMLDYSKMLRLSRRFRDVQTEDFGEDEATVAEVARSLDEALRIALPHIPDEVVAKLGDVQKFQIISAFSKAVGPASEAAPPTMTPADPTGETSSLVSAGSTASGPGNS